MDTLPLLRTRWYESHANIPLGEICLPHLLETEGLDGTGTPRLEIVDRNIPIIWPWDILHWREGINQLGNWIADKPEKASMKCLEPQFKLCTVNI